MQRQKRVPDVLTAFGKRISIADLKILKPSLFRSLHLRFHAQLRDNHAQMASDTVVHSDQPPMTVAELVTFTKKELDADAERQARLQAASAGELPRESQTGVTLDLSHRNLHALPVEVIALIKDKVERYACSGGGWGRGRVQGG